MWGVVSGELFFLLNEADMRHMYPILSPRQTPLINHGTERLSNLAKVTQLVLIYQNVRLFFASLTEEVTCCSQCQ